MKVVIINDTTGPHFGCQLVMETYQEQLNRVRIEIIGTIPRAVQNINEYPDIIKKADLLIVNGEGSIHHGRRMELIELAKDFPAILLNCVYQDNPLSHSLQHFKYISTRETESAKALKAHGIEAEVIPDIMLTSNRLKHFQKGEPTQELGLTDSILDLNSGFSAKIGLGHIDLYLQTLAQYKKLCIGRYHGILAAAILKIPFSAWTSNTHKNYGLMKDMGIESLYAEKQADAIKLVPTYFDEKIDHYVEDAKIKIDRLFEKIHQFV